VLATKLRRASAINVMRSPEPLSRAEQTLALPNLA
jgi:hypothetical protein